MRRGKSGASQAPKTTGVKTNHCQHSITGDHSKQDQILLVKIGEYIGFCV